MNANFLIQFERDKWPLSLLFCFWTVSRGSITTAALIVDGDSVARSSDMDHKSLSRKNNRSLLTVFLSSPSFSPSSAPESLPIPMLPTDGQPEIVLPICH